MISKVNATPLQAQSYEPVHPISFLKPFNSSLTTLRSGNETPVFFKIIYVIFFPILWPIQTVLDRIVLTTDELEDFEKLLEGAVWGGALLFLERKEGEEKIVSVLKACDDLYAKLSRKWFPNLEGIFFLRMNLIKIKMRAHAALNHENEVNACRQLLMKLGMSVPKDVENQTQGLLIISNSNNKWLLKFLNGLSNVVLKIIAKLKS